MKTVAFQFAVTGNISENLTKTKNAIRRASEAGVRLLVLPECALTGYTYCERPAPGETEKTCRDIGAKQSYKAKIREHPIWLAYTLFAAKSAGS